MTLSYQQYLDACELYAAAGHHTVPVRIKDMKDMTARIAAVDKKALAKGKIKPVEKGVSVSRKIGRKAKAERQEMLWNAAAKPSKAFEEGRLSYPTSYSQANPYDGRTTNGRQWRAGWEHAAKEARRANRKAKA